MYLDRLITNIKLYRKDIGFVNMFVDDYAELNCEQYLPTKSGILFIDFESELILDSQRVSAINKITPTEIKMSLNGKIPDEVFSNSMHGRFVTLVSAGYLKGFERWQDNGHHLDRDVASKSIEQLMEMVLNSADYGQFVFETKPFKVEIYNQTDFADQVKLFNRAVELNLIPEDKHQQWKDYLETLK